MPTILAPTDWTERKAFAAKLLKAAGDEHAADVTFVTTGRGPAYDVPDEVFDQLDADADDVSNAIDPNEPAAPTEVDSTPAHPIAVDDPDDEAPAKAPAKKAPAKRAGAKTKSTGTKAAD